MKTIFYIISINSIVLLLGLVACKSPETHENSELTTDSTRVEMTPEALKLAGIKLGFPEKKIISEIIYSKGIIKVFPENIAKISSLQEGHISSIDVKLGDFVRKGQVLAKIANPEIIDLQKDYLTLKSELEYMENEYSRQKELNEKKINSTKEYQRFLADYQQMQAKMKAIKIKFDLLRMDVEKIEEGNFFLTIPVCSPINGFVDEVFITNGQFIDSQHTLFEVTNNNDFYLEFRVFEKDLNKIYQGQNILYYCSIDDSIKNLTATVTSISSKVDEETKTFKVIARPSQIQAGMRHGRYINVKAFVSSDSLEVIPESAIIQTNRNSYIFVNVSDNSFKKIRVQTGIVADGYAEIIKYMIPLNGNAIVVQGANYLEAEMNKEE